MTNILASLRTTADHVHNWATALAVLAATPVAVWRWHRNYHRGRR